jgi:chitinase
LHDSNALAGNFNQLKELKAKYKKLKILISIGGWRLSDQFSDAVKPANLKGFVQSCIDMFIKGNMPGLAPGAAAGIFDGIDIDWEYPAFQRVDDQSKGGYVSSPNDTQNYTAMLAEFRKQLGNKHLLTIATPAGQDKFSKIQLSKIGQYVDWINLMTFDFHGSWETPTETQAPLHCDADDSSPTKTYCIDYSVTSYRQAGIPAAKINLGLLFYGYGSTSGTRNKRGPYQKDVQPTPGQHGASSSDNATKGNRNFNASTFKSFDNVQEIIDKVNYAKSMGLGGVFCWFLNDDLQGTLLKTMTDHKG